MNEREAFKKWILTHPDNLELISYEEKLMWEAWQASANREGYKLVLVGELLRKAQNIRALNTGEYASDEIEENVCEIEAIIGAVDEST